MLLAANLTEFGLFKGISENELTDMLVCIKPKLTNFDKNEFLCMEGEDFTGIGLLQAGSAIITKENFTGERTMMGVIKAGELFGEMAAFCGNGKWPATVIAQENCSVIFLPKATFSQNCSSMCKGHSTMIKNMLYILSQKALMLNNKIEYLTIKSLRGKISRYLLEQHKKSGTLTFNIPLSRNELSEFFNVSRPSLSREMCRMRDEGIIDIYKSSIKIMDLDRLKGMVE
jgi:CRP-like cAMP-binding protein